MDCVVRNLENISRLLKNEINSIPLLEYNFHHKIIQNEEFPIDFSPRKIIRTEILANGLPNSLVIQPPANDAERIRNEEIRVCKKSFENIMTDLINRDLVFEISDNLHISKFQ